MHTAVCLTTMEVKGIILTFSGDYYGNGKVWYLAYYESCELGTAGTEYRVSCDSVEEFRVP